MTSRKWLSSTSFHFQTNKLRIAFAAFTCFGMPEVAMCPSSHGLAHVGPVSSRRYCHYEFQVCITPITLSNRAVNVFESPYEELWQRTETGSFKFVPRLAVYAETCGLKFKCKCSCWQSTKGATNPTHKLNS